MGKKKKRKGGSTPLRKQYNRKTRLPVAQKWVPTYEGENIVKGYAKHFGVDKTCAVTELEMLGYSFSEKYKHQLEEENRRKAEERRERKRKKQEEEPVFDSDEHFYESVISDSHEYMYRDLSQLISNGGKNIEGGIR